MKSEDNSAVVHELELAIKRECIGLFMQFR